MTLAIDGGTPIHDGVWPTWPPAVDDEQRRLVNEVLESGLWGSNTGALSEQFAQRFAQVHGASRGVNVTNGTIALFIALRAAGVGPGDEVIVPAYTFVACATSVLLLGATPVIADVDPDHLHLSAETIEAALSDRTRAIMVVHLAGSPAPMTEILELASNRDLVVIEDSAQAHGAHYRGRPVGSIGNLGTFSFQSSKAMTAGEGGLIVTNDHALADTVWSLCNVGRELGGAWYHHASIGWNLRTTEFQAAILLPWIDRLEGEIAVREEFVSTFSTSLDEAGTDAVIVADPKGTTRNSRHLMMIRLGLGVERSYNREWVARALDAEGVSVDLGYPSLGGLEALQSGARVMPTPRLDRVAESILWIRQSMLMAGAAGGERSAAAFAKVLADPRAWSNT